MIEALGLVKDNIKLTEDIFTLKIETKEKLNVRCGQFVNVSIPNRKDLILKRPFGIVNYTENTFDIAIQVRGEGTNELSKVKKGDKLNITVGLGNGFYLLEKEKKIALIGGGIGVFPLLSVKDTYKDREIYSFLGFRSKDNMCFTDDFEKTSKKTFISTDDGSFGEKGNAVASFIKHIDEIKPDVVLACGPKIMFKTLKKEMEKYPEIRTLISLEERMGCGVGACLVCTCKIYNKKGDTEHRRVCTDGPVFNIKEVNLDD